MLLTIVTTGIYAIIGGLSKKIFPNSKFFFIWANYSLDKADSLCYCRAIMLNPLQQINYYSLAGDVLQHILADSRSLSMAGLFFLKG